MKKIINMMCGIFILGLMVGPTCFVHAQDITYGIIRIKDPEHPGRGITIHDRNLGATATGYGATDDINTYGYYFQWGNNYGFSSDPNETILTGKTQVDASSYGPDNPYSSDTFITGNPDWSSERNDNLRGGEGDSRDGNGRGYPVENPTDRRGPCPIGYHVPSAGEWSKLLEFWADSYTGSLTLHTNSSNKSKYFESNTTALNTFYNDLYIPIAGKRYYQDSNFNKVGSQALLRSSSSKDSTNSLPILYGENSNLYSNGTTDHRANAFPIRCFYDSYRLPVKITYEVNGGYWKENESTKDKVITYTKDNDNSGFSGDIVLGTVKRNNNCGSNGDKKCMFGGRYTLTGDELWTGNISEDITLYAKWLEFDDKDISYSGVNFSIIDRNLGAEISGTGKNAYGYYLTGGENDIICPKGYHIPDTGEWLGIKKLLGSDFDGELVKSILDLPLAGKMTNNENIEDEGFGYYLASNGTEMMYAKIDDSGIEIESLNEGEKVSVRCFKDYNSGTIKFHTNGGKNIADIVAVNRREDGQPLKDTERDNSIFTGWYTTINFQEGSKLKKNINYKNEEEIDLYAKWECEEGYTEGADKCDAIYFDITWIDGDGNTLKTDNVKWGGMPVYDGDTPTKSSTVDYKYTFNNNWLPAITAAFEDTIYTAQFDAEYIKKSGGSSGGGGRGSKKDAVIQSGTKGSEESSATLPVDSPDDLNPSVTTGQLPLKEELNEIKQGVPPLQMGMSKEQGDYPQEFIDAYNFAYQYGITSKLSIQDAKMYSPLTRIQMAKMLSNYAINVLGKEPDLSKGAIKFSDVSNKMDKQYNNAITLAYQLGIMGQNMKKNKFRPYDEVTRAEFATALSRLLYGTQDGKSVNYYEPHITKLYNKGIITKTNPAIKEKRGYVMLMLMRNKK